MVRLIRIFVVLIVVSMLGTPCLSYDTWVTREGVYIDCTDQVPNSPEKAVNPEKVPKKPHVSRNTVMPFNEYYDRNYYGYRGEEGKQEIIPNYNRRYGHRDIEPYTKQEYIDVWCSGDQNVGGVDCLTDKYAISFYPVSEWALGIPRSVMRARKYKDRVPVAFLYVTDLGADAGDMQSAKKWAQQFNNIVYFGTIDANIPWEWIP